MSLRVFIRCALIWAFFTCAPGFIAIIRFSRFDPYNSWSFLSLLLVALMEAGLLWSLVQELQSSRQAIVGGAGLGLVLPIVGAYLLQKAMAGFDNWSLVLGALAVSLPSAFGGALAGWTQWRSK